MKIDMQSLTMDPRWSDYEDEKCKFKIRPYPAAQEVVNITSEGIRVVAQDEKKKFMYCLVGWEGLEDFKGVNIPYSEKTKEQFFDFHTQDKDLKKMVFFVLSETNRLKEVIEEDLGNLPDGASGVS